jgi:5'-methylthioadenosine phosphorylase
MTALPEAKLAREAELCYATLALSTDYDCWREEEEAVTVDAVVAVLKRNVSLAREVVRRAALLIGKKPPRTCACSRATDNAIMTHEISPQAYARLQLIIGRTTPQPA